MVDQTEFLLIICLKKSLIMHNLCIRYFIVLLTIQKIYLIMIKKSVL